MLTISTQSISEKLSEVLCAATGATLDPLPFVSKERAIHIAFPATKNGQIPSITLLTDSDLNDQSLTQITFSIALKSLDIFPLLLCILVFLRERKTISLELEENILSALHEALLNALIHGNLGQYSDYNNSYKMFDHFAAIGEMLLTNDVKETLKMSIEILPEQIAISITDSGKGFSEDAIVPPGESALHGRGMTIIRECADIVNISDHGSTISMIFTCGPQQAQLFSKLENSHILIVEDVAVNRAIISRILKQRGFKTISIAIDGEEAYEKTLLLKPDLVILDLMLPRMDGYEYCRRIRQNPAFEHLPIVVQTVLSQPEQRSKAFACGASDLVTKPINAYELIARIVLLLEKQSLLNDLREYQDRIQHELSSARSMQHSIMPNQQLIKDLEARYSIKTQSFFQPSSEIGGDLWGIRMISEAECAFYIVDFSGHGITAALNVFRFQAMLQGLMLDMTDPASVLEKLNKKLKEILSIGQFATMFYAVINTLDDTLHYAAAGSTNPAIIKKDKSIEWLDGKGLPLGAANGAEYKNHTTTFTEEDGLLLYSDALIETANTEGGYITTENIESCLKAASHPLAFNKIIAEFKKQNTATDDLTIIMLSR